MIVQYLILQDVAAANNAKEMVELQMENSQADSEAVCSLLLWYQSLQNLLGEGRSYDQFVRSYENAMEELEVGLITG